MLPMYSKCPAKRRWRIHQANILPGRGALRCTDPPLNHAWRATLAMHDGFHRTNLATLDGSRWTNPATLDGFTGRIRPCMMAPLGESYRAQWFLSCKSCHPALATPVGQSTLDGANGFHRRVRHCHFRECPLKNTRITVELGFAGPNPLQPQFRGAQSAAMPRLRGAQSAQTLNPKATGAFQH